MAAGIHELILRAQQGDASALDRLLAECQFDARRYAMRHCMTSAIDDAVQEALLIVARRVRALQTATSFASWLFTIVRRECRRLSRKMFAYEELDEQRIPPDELRLELPLRSNPFRRTIWKSSSCGILRN